MLVRKKFKELIGPSLFWNQKIAELNITEIKEHTMEIRFLVSADNANNLWKLRCEMREKLIKYIVDNYPECLTKTRNVNIPITSEI